MTTFTDLAKTIMKPTELPNEFTMDDIVNNTTLRCMLNSKYHSYSMLDCAIEMLNKNDSITMDEVQSFFDSMSFICSSR